MWFRLTENANETDRAKLRSRLWRPPMGQVADARSPWSAENEMAALRAFKSQLGDVSAAPAAPSG